jgi:hypothetical protein
MDSVLYINVLDWISRIHSFIRLRFTWTQDKVLHRQLSISSFNFAGFDGFDFSTQLPSLRHWTSISVFCT